MLFSMSNELRLVKWMRFFERNCIVKWVIFFASFCWLWDFLLENLKIKKNSDDVHWIVWTNTCMPVIIFSKKRILNMRFWIIYILVQVSFLGTALRHFSQCFFLVFVACQPWWPTFYFLWPCNMFILWSFVHNLFQFGAMINRWMK